MVTPLGAGTTVSDRPYWDGTNWVATGVSNTDAEVAAAVAASHAAVTLSAELDAILALSTQALDLDTQLANTILAGPATGAAAKPTARALIAADIPQAVTMLAAYGQLTIAFSGAAKFCVVGNPNATSTTDLRSQMRCGKAGTLGRFRVFIATNTLNGNLVFAVRKNGTNTAVTITFAATATGAQTDDVNTVAVAVDDLLNINYDASAASSGSADLRLAQCEIS